MAKQFKNTSGVPQNAAIALSYRDSDTGKLCFLMGQPESGNKSSQFIFPGGQVDTDDLSDAFGDEGKAYEYAAIRELEEETGIDLRKLSIKLEHIQTLNTPASNGYPAKDVHFYSAHLGTLSPAAVSTLVKALDPKDDLKNLRFEAQDSTMLNTCAKKINVKQIKRISDLIKKNQHSTANPSAVDYWIKSMEKPQPIHSGHSFWTPKQQSQQHTHEPSHSHTPQGQTLISFSVSLLLMVSGVGLLFFGLMTLNPLGLLGILPLFAGLGLFNAAPKNNTPEPRDVAMSFSR